MSKKVYIAGCGGMLGYDVYHVFKNSNYDVLATDIDVNESWIKYGDVTNYYEMRNQIIDFNPDLIINLAALTDLEYCEKNIELSWLTNAYGCENLCNISLELDIPYVYISTAGIFDGKQDLYNDFDTPNPLSIYAKSKLYGENYTLNKNNKSYVFRAGWMMGGFSKDKKFVGKILKKIKNNEILEVVTDKFGTPTYTKDFALSILSHYENNLPYGLYNMVCGGNTNRYEVGKKIIEILNLNTQINQITSDKINLEYFAPRPLSEKLINLKLNKLNSNHMRDWEICLEEYLNSFVL